MKGLSQKDIKVIETFCGETYADKLRILQKDQEDTTVKVINTGMVSAGKSSLYNALIGSEDNYFEVSAPRTTIYPKNFDHGIISYVDTPGISATSEDDEVAFHELLKSDIIMVIHNIALGELRKCEVEWIERLVKSIGNKMICKEKIIFVNTWKDKKEKSEDYEELLSKIKKQVFECVGTEITCFELSTEKYRQGIDKNKEVLVNSSGVLELRQYIEEYAKHYAEKKREINQNEYLSTIREVQGILEQINQEKERKVNEIYERAWKAQQTRRNAWDSVYNSFASKRNILTRMENELKKI